MTSDWRSYPAKRLLHKLGESEEIEHFTLSEIETLPVERIQARLDYLGITYSLPPFLEALCTLQCEPAQRITAALDAEEFPEADVIETMPLEEIELRLNRVGFDHLASSAAAHDLVLEALADKAEIGAVHSNSTRKRSPVPSRRLALAVPAVVIAFIGLSIQPLVQDHVQTASKCSDNTNSEDCKLSDKNDFIQGGFSMRADGPSSRKISEAYCDFTSRKT